MVPLSNWVLPRQIINQNSIESMLWQRRRSDRFIEVKRQKIAKDGLTRVQSGLINALRTIGRVDFQLVITTRLQRGLFHIVVQRLVMITLLLQSQSYPSFTTRID